MLRYLTSLACIGAIMLLALPPAPASARLVCASEPSASTQFPRPPDGLQ